MAAGGRAKGPKLALLSIVTSVKNIFGIGKSPLALGVQWVYIMSIDNKEYPMNYYLTLTYKNQAGEICTEEIQAFGTKQSMLIEGAKFLRSIGLDHTAIVRANYRCPAWAGLGLAL